MSSFNILKKDKLKEYISQYWLEQKNGYIYINTKKHDELLDNDENILKILRKYALTKNGFIDKEMRSIIWPLILSLDYHSPYLLINNDNEDNMDLYNNNNNNQLINKKNILQSPRILARQYTNELKLNQITLDIDRSLYHFKKTKKWSHRHRNIKRGTLKSILLAIFKKYPFLHYYQGLHDVISIILLIIDDEILAFAVSERLCLYYFRDCMKEDFLPLMSIINIMPDIIKLLDNEIYKLLFIDCNMQPYFTLSWIITWLSHDLNNFDIVCRLFDIFICSPPFYSIYISISLILYRRDNLLKMSYDKNNNFIGDYADIYQYLTKLNIKEIDFEEIIQNAEDIYQNYPPNKIFNSKYNIISNVKLNEINNYQIIMKKKRNDLRLNFNINNYKFKSNNYILLYHSYYMKKYLINLYKFYKKKKKKKKNKKKKIDNDDINSLSLISFDYNNIEKKSFLKRHLLEGASIFIAILSYWTWINYHNQL